MKKNKNNNFDLNRKWYFFDLRGKVLGRAAVEISNFLRGRSNNDFSYNSDSGNYIVVVNASKVVLTGNNKLEKKKYYDHSGYPGGLRERSSAVMLEKYPTEMFHRVVKGLMPHNKISKKQLTRLFVYPDENHLHKAQERDFLII